MDPNYAATLMAEMTRDLQGARERGIARTLSDEEQHALTELFTYHSATEEDTKRYSLINNACRLGAEVIMSVCPSSPDRTTSIRKLREARMDANASIATKGAMIPR